MSNRYLLTHYSAYNVLYGVFSSSRRLVPLPGGISNLTPEIEMRRPRARAVAKQRRRCRERCDAHLPREGAVDPMRKQLPHFLPRDNLQ